eukprot:9471941-Pyramimonas_sp.AAC.1
MFKFREHNFQLSKSHQKFRRDFSSQLARQCVGITLKLPAASLGKLYESRVGRVPRRVSSRKRNPGPCRRRACFRARR